MTALLVAAFGRAISEVWRSTGTSTKVSWVRRKVRIEFTVSWELPEVKPREGESGITGLPRSQSRLDWAMAVVHIRFACRECPFVSTKGADAEEHADAERHCVGVSGEIQPRVALRIHTGSQAAPADFVRSQALRNEEGSD
jgi:hypothetical protein